MIRKVKALTLLYTGFALLLAGAVHAQQSTAKPAFTFREVMVPMRDCRPISESWPRTATSS